MKEKTLRYPGHIDLMRVFRETGLFDTEPVEVDGRPVVPRDVTASLLAHDNFNGAFIQLILLAQLSDIEFLVAFTVVHLQIHQFTDKLLLAHAAVFTDRVDLFV